VRPKVRDLADLDGRLKLQIVDERGHGKLSGVPLPANRAAQIHPRHDLSAKNIAESVGVLREHVLVHLGERSAGGLGRHPHRQYASRPCDVGPMHASFAAQKGGGGLHGSGWQPGPCFGKVQFAV
jgi:hypothetical protein